METTLRIMTNTDLADEGQIRMKFWTVGGQHNAGLNIKIAATPQYWIHYCMASYQNFPTDTVLPTENEKIWAITITRTAGVRLIVHCNGEEVLNVLLSDSVCPDSSDWSTLWNKDYDKISFPSGDASYYIPFSPGNC